MLLKNIIFDLGGVLLNLDIERTKAAFAALMGSIEKHQQAHQALINKQLFDDFEIGKIAPTEFISELQAHNPNPTTPEQIKIAWSAMLLDIPKQRIKLLQTLRQRGFRLFLLSNTNALHLDTILQYVQQKHQLNLGELFDKTYYSHLLELRKPNPAIYEFVLKDANIQAQESLFIDDLETNITSAQNVGLRTALHPANGNLSQTLQQHVLF